MCSTHLPKLLTSIFPTHPLQYLRPAGMLVDEFVERVDGVVDDDVEARFDGRVGGYLGWGECFGHCCGFWRGGVVEEVERRES